MDSEPDEQSLLRFESGFSILLIKYKNQKIPIRELMLYEPIPAGLTVHDFLEKFFTDIPRFEISGSNVHNQRESDYDQIVRQDLRKIKVLKEKRRPNNFISFFRFLELVRRNLRHLESNMEQIRNTFNMINASLKNKERRVNRNELLFLKKIQLLFQNAVQIKKSWSSLLKILYEEGVRQLNEELAVRHGVDLKTPRLKAGRSVTRANVFDSSYYNRAMEDIFPLLESVEQTTVAIGGIIKILYR